MRIFFMKELLNNNFKKLGVIVARHPCLFILCPIFISVLLMTGLQKIKYLQDLESLYSVSGSESLIDRSHIDSLFYINKSSNFDPNRVTRAGYLGILIVVSKDGGSILRREILAEISVVDSLSQTITISWDNKQWKYENLCAKWNNTCFQYDKTPLRLESENKTFDSSSLGGIEISEKGELISAKALRLFYYLDDSSETKTQLSQNWEKSFLHHSKTWTFQNISIERYTSRSIEKDLIKSFQRTLPYILISFCLLTFYGSVIFLNIDCLQSKPWMGIINALSSVIAVASGFGFLAYCDMYFSALTMIIPFLVLGIGTADTFIMLSVWKRTSSESLIEQRLSEVYLQSGTSITISFSINFISFLISGILSPFREFGIFCYYLSSCLVFNYIYQITFIGGCIAVFGYTEKKQLHSFTCQPINQNTVTEKHFEFHRRSSKARKEKKRFNLPSRLTIESTIENIFAKMSTKLGLIILYLLYLITVCFNVTKIKKDYKLEAVASYDTYINSYFSVLRDNFHQEKLQIIIHTPLNYADPEILEEIEKVIQILESEEIVLMECWIRSYLIFLSNEKGSLRNYNITNEDFISVLNNRFLSDSAYSKFVEDIVFNQNHTEIIASRFISQINSTQNRYEYWKKIQRVKGLIAETKFPVIIFHSNFFVYEGVDKTMSVILRTIAIVSVAIIFICPTALMNNICVIAFCLLFLSTVFGTICFISFWDIRLNPISMTYFVTFIAIPVNYFTHSSFAYTSFNTENKTCNLLKNCGMQIFQAALITTLCTTIFSIRPTTLSVAFKIALLTCLSASLHAVIFLPLITSLLECVNNKIVNAFRTKLSRNISSRFSKKFRHPAIGNIYNGSVVISHIDLSV